MKIEGRQIPPNLPTGLPLNSKWLSGDGAGAWFHILNCNNREFKIFNIKRFTPKGVLDCDRNYVLQQNAINFDLSKPFKFTHLSHGAKCKVIQENILFEFIWEELC
ncbi:MAG: hypothetical protein L3J14_03210 [Flavobacteriaceae bacterium]|nr:hypothetical protein [Flavobacteriaceae bacterium]